MRMWSGARMRGLSLSTKIRIRKSGLALGRENGEAL